MLVFAFVFSSFLIFALSLPLYIFEFSASLHSDRLMSYWYLRNSVQRRKSYFPLQQYVCTVSIRASVYVHRVLMHNNKVGNNLWIQGSVD